MAPGWQAWTRPRRCSRSPAGACRTPTSASGDLQFLPYEDDSFDVVTGFNTFFFAADMTAALREAGRVARPGARVLIQVWGRPERCDLTPMVQAVARLRGAERGVGPTLFKPGVLEAIAGEAGLSPGEAFDLSTAAEYPGEADLLRLVLAPGPMVAAIEAVGEEAVSAAVLEALAPSAPRRAATGSRTSGIT